MKKSLLIISIILFCAGLFVPAHGQNADLEGTWIIDQVQIKKTTNGVASVKTYYMSQDFKSFADCPKKVIFAENEVIFENKSGKQSETPYSVEGNQMKRIFAGSILTYEYTLSNVNNIQLNNSISYTNNGADNIIEEYTFYGHREQ